jgi:hypothetical protein
MQLNSPAAEFYPHRCAPALEEALFKNPTAPYRGTPLWSWNNRLDRTQLFRQMDALQKMGLGGFHIHPRTGLDTAYLGEEFMETVRACIEKAKAQDMLAWLYDEDRWPSGFAGGLVTQDPQFRAKHLLWTCRPYDPNHPEKVAPIASAQGGRTGNGVLLARYEAVLENGFLARYQRLEESAGPAPGGREWFAYLETAEPNSWFNNQTYVDTLSPAAMHRFIQTTHERYFEVVGDEFGKTIPAIFTDEPQFVHKQFFNRADETRDLVIPFTGDLLESYFQAYGQKLEDFLPELFWQLPDNAPSLARYRYHDHVCERFTQAFADQIGGWCESHHIALTGHMMEEPTLQSQTAALGEAMRSYRSFHIPGIDMLCDAREYNTAKQAQSAAHQFGCPGVLSELYGVTNWGYPFWGHKSQGDWQAALGVTVRVHHLTWVSMAGEAKRDYPASIGPHSPWFEEYSLVENHFARLNTVLTRGGPVVRVSVIHPVESFWLAFGPVEQSKTERAGREENFKNLTDWLLFGLIDFDFICESLLPLQNQTQSGSTLSVGAMDYEVVLVPGLKTIRAATLERLEVLVDAGGRVLFLGEIPSLVDAAPSDRAQKLALRCERLAFDRATLLAALESVREVEVKWGAIDPLHAMLHGQTAGESLLYQLRQDGERRYLFICNAHRTQAQTGAQIRVKGAWNPSLLDTFSSEKGPFTARLEGGDTILEHDFPAHGHLLLELEPGEPTSRYGAPKAVWKEQARLDGPNSITLSEPNVLLLDQARFRFDDGHWQNLEEVLRVENFARAHWGLPAKDGHICQPWADVEPSPSVGILSLKFVIESEVEVSSPRLALEDAAKTEIFLDGEKIPSAIEGWWVDEAIQTVALPDLGIGKYDFELRMPFSRKSNVEWCYLLGDFGVRVLGRRAKIIAPVRELAWGDWTTQGLPFYAGNVTYRCRISDCDGKKIALRVPYFRAPLLSLELDDKETKKIAFAPFRAELGVLEADTQSLKITAFGNRVNAFGAVHNVSGTTWFGPPAWRSKGDGWAYEYGLQPMGILYAPLIEACVEAPTKLMQKDRNS